MDCTAMIYPTDLQVPLVLYHSRWWYVNSSCFLFTCPPLCSTCTNRGLDLMPWEQLSLPFTLDHCSGRRKDRAWGLVVSGTQCCQGIRWEHVPSPLHPPTPSSTLHLISSDTMPIPQWVARTAVFIDVAVGQWSAPRLCFVCSPFTVMLHQVACNSSHLQMLLLFWILSGLVFNNALKIVCQVDGIWWSIRMSFRGITTDRLFAIKSRWQMTWNYKPRHTGKTVENRCSC